MKRAAKSAATQAARRDSGGGETILVVEDEADIRELLTEILEASGYAVLSAATPDGAFALAERHRGALDLLLTDVVMAGGGGRMLAERIRRLRSETTVVYISGHTDDRLSSYLNLGHAVTLLQKPFTPRTLLDTVRGALDRGGS